MDLHPLPPRILSDIVREGDERDDSGRLLEERARVILTADAHRGRPIGAVQPPSLLWFRSFRGWGRSMALDACGAA